MATQYDVIFMGTPEFAARVLHHVLHRPGTRILCVLTQPDRPKGRGRKPAPSAVKVLAREEKLDVWQPGTLSTPEAQDYLLSLSPDFLLVAAYGLLLPSSVLSLPRHAALNVHASLLPKFRGAAPIQRAIANGEHVTGISIMRMQAGLDCGPILMQRALAIGMEDTAQDVHDQLAELGGQCLVQTLDLWQSQELLEIPQDEAQASYAPKLHKSEGSIQWDRNARDVHNHIRAMTPWPGARTELTLPGQSKPLQVILLPGNIGEARPQDMAPGDFLTSQSGEHIGFACADRLYWVHTLKPASRAPMPASAFICGYLSKAQTKGPC